MGLKRNCATSPSLSSSAYFLPVKKMLLLFLLLLFHSSTALEGKETEDGENSKTGPGQTFDNEEKGVTLNTCCPLDLNNLEQELVHQDKGRFQRCNGKAHMSLGSESDDNPFSYSFQIPNHLMAENKSMSFRVKPFERLGCKETQVTTIHMSWNASLLQPSTSRETLFLKNGYLKLRDHYYHMDEYCINGKNKTTIELAVCPQDCQGSRPCVIKCCTLSQLYNFNLSPESPKKGCQNPGEDDEYFAPQMYSDFYSPSSKPMALAPHYIEKYPSKFKFSCHGNKTTIIFTQRVSEVIRDVTNVNFTGHPFKIRDDGMVLYKEADGTCAVVDPSTTQMCVDGIVNYGLVAGEPFRNSPDELIIVLCVAPIKDGESEDGSKIYGGLMIVSSLFLLLTIAVYFMLWERQTVHGWTILSHTISLFFMYLFLGTSHLLRVTERYSLLNTPICVLVGVLCHFFFLSTFCWLSMISIDLWLTFRAMTPRRGAKSKGFKRYTMYSILGWGIPLVIVGTGWSLSREQTESTCNTVLIPGYGVQNCYLQEKALGVYLYYPIAAMLGINILFFAITSVKLYMYQNSTKMATKDETQQQFYRLFFKLFFVMGVMYIFELISWVVSGSGVHWYWATFDILNILRAVAVFIIFVCKPDILWALEQNYTWLKPLLIPFACITRKKRSMSRRHAGSESVGLNSTMMSMSTKQSALRSTVVRHSTSPVVSNTNSARTSVTNLQHQQQQCGKTGDNNAHARMD